VESEKWRRDRDYDAIPQNDRSVTDRARLGEDEPRNIPGLRNSIERIRERPLSRSVNVKADAYRGSRHCGWIQRLRAERWTEGPHGVPEYVPGATFVAPSS
jgi:hypothetical protein